MSSDIAIKINNVSKHYHIYDKPQDRLKQGLFRGRKQFYKEFRALVNITCDIKKGETVGIIGRNGSGKSTLLQIICGTLTPTGGEVALYGRVAALLELGAGFNPEFTGRENVFMYASILGLSSDEINKKYDDIVGFSEIDDFIDQPVKTYSSGMYVRLAFSVAINVDPEILIIDEALAVGDELFQQKCYSRINTLRRNGVTVLFVSHSASAVVELCNRAIVLDRGELVFEGKPKTSIALYHKLTNAEDSVQEKVRQEIVKHGAKALITEEGSGNESDLEIGESATIKPFYDPSFISKNSIKYEPKGVEITNPVLTTLKDNRVNNLVHGEEYIYSYKVKYLQDAMRIQYGMLIKSVTGLEIGGVVYPSVSSFVQNEKQSTEILFKVQFRCLLNPGVYFMNAGVQGEVNNNFGYLHRLIDTLVFRVQPDAGMKNTGIVDLDFKPVLNRAVH